MDSEDGARTLPHVLVRSKLAIDRNFDIDIWYRDATTRNQDIIICPRPESSNLYTAGDGAFHSYNFVANIGKFVTQMLDGDLEDVPARE